MLKIKVEGVYESDTGSGQRQYEGYEYSFNISKPTDKGIMTHIQRRFIPYLIGKDKEKVSKIFSRLRTCVITDSQNVADKDSIVGKDINELNEWQIQDLACLFDLYEVPLPHTCSISEMREKATLAYMKVVLKIPMDTPKQRAELDFLKHFPDGTYKLDLHGEKVYAKVPTGYFEHKEKEVEKKSLSFFESLVDLVSGDKQEEKEKNPESKKDKNKQSEKDDDGFPSADSLLDK